MRKTELVFVEGLPVFAAEAWPFDLVFDEGPEGNVVSVRFAGAKVPRLPIVVEFDKVA